MKTLPRPGRRLPHPFLRPTLLGALLVMLAGTAAASANPPSQTWPFEWRPSWIPGDPLESPHGFLPAPWIALGHPTSGLLVALDPVTRLPIKPSAAQRAALAAELDASRLLAPDGPLPVEHIPGGGELAHLQGRFQVFTVARRGADGRFTTSCVELPRKDK